MRGSFGVAVLLCCVVWSETDSSQDRPPIIDMHMHALPPTFAGEPGALHPRTGESAPSTETALMQASLEAMERNNIV